MITSLLFESPWFAGVIGGVGFVMLLFAGRGMEPRRRGKWWLAWMAGTVLLFVLQAAVTTDRERLYRDLLAVATCVVDKNTAGLSDYLASEFESQGMGRDGFIAHVAGQLRTIDVDMPWFRRCDITIAGERATMELTAVGGVRVQGVSGRALSEWTLTWRRSIDGWRIMEIVQRRLLTL